MPEVQNYANHTRKAPPLENAIALAFLANLFLAVYRLAQDVTVDRIVNLAMAFALIMLLFAFRRQVVTVQDRVIRNEMRERLRPRLPPDLYAATMALPIRQLVALRFAGDAELPELAREVIDGRLTTPKDIKMRVRDWQADYLRC
jgi:hypothetical protein